MSRDPGEAPRALTSPRQRCEEPSTNDCRGPADLEKLHYDDETDTWYECMLNQRHDQYTWVIIPAPDDGGRTGANFNDRLPSDSRFHRPRVARGMQEPLHTPDRCRGGLTCVAAPKTLNRQASYEAWSLSSIKPS
jgi:hypothetical protein